MKKNKKIILFTILSLLFNINVYASCTEEEINEFKKIEDEYKITYEFNKETKMYDIYLKNIETEKYRYNIYTDYELNCDEYNENLLKCTDFPLDIYEIEIVGRTKTCNDKLKSIIIDLSKYNSFSEDPLCEGIEEFVLCQPTYDKEIDYDTFVSRIETYKRTKENKEQEAIDKNKEEKKNNLFTEITEYIKENIFSITVVTIFIILMVITIIITAKSVRKSRRLE